MKIISTIVLINIFIVILTQDDVPTVETEEQIRDVPLNKEIKEEINEEENENRQVEVNFYTEWSNKMSDYQPDYVYIVPIKKLTIQKYYENIVKVPVLVRGAFLTHFDNKLKAPIEVIINDPNNNQVFVNRTIASIISFEAKIPGEYTIQFKNFDKKEESITVTFTLNTYQKELLKKENLSFTEEKLNSLLKFVTSMGTEEEFTGQFVKERKKCKSLFIFYYI